MSDALPEVDELRFARLNGQTAQRTEFKPLAVYVPESTFTPLSAESKERLLSTFVREAAPLFALNRWVWYNAGDYTVPNAAQIRETAGRLLDELNANCACISTGRIEASVEQDEDGKNVFSLQVVAMECTIGSEEETW